MELQKPRGTRDFLFKEMNERKYVEKTLKRVFETYGYQEIKTPLFEDLSLFTLKSGEGITEQIYHFQDKGGRDLALRPELTAPVARLYINQLQKTPKPIKMYYFGSCFRYERPQAGRFRQFWQLGCELIGGKSPDAEGEVIALAAHCLDDIGLKDFEIHIGNLGIIRGILNQAQIEDQDQIMALIDKGVVEELRSYLENLETEQKYKDILLDLIGIEGHQEVIERVSKLLTDYPDASKSLQELKDLLEVLESFGFLDYVVNLGIARGLDYYSGTVFEIYVHGLGAQKQISGGGTYNLIEVFGGEKVESTGFAFGFDRVMEALKQQEVVLPLSSVVEVFVAPVSPDMKFKSFEIADQLRKAGLSTEIDLAGKKFKKLLSHANNLGANFVILVGARDLENGQVTVKNMESGDQEIVALEEVVDLLVSTLRR
ncbi:MAG TPA: histidine--tRNA ligase [Methanobacteriaceae archaeon]|nr:histidine--tRNA ligase [Methanobacteriaceae archaeon]